FFSSRRRHTRCYRDWSSDVCSSDLIATQWLHVDRDQLAGCLGLPVEKIRLTMAGIGGAFGAREDLSMQAHACMLAMRTRRPVKRSEEHTSELQSRYHLVCRLQLEKK